MGKSSPKPPPAPDPSKSLVDIESPWGSVNYTPIEGGRYSQNISLAPWLQGIVDQSGQFAGDMFSQLGGMYSNPMDFSSLGKIQTSIPGYDSFADKGKEVEDLLYKQYSTRLDDQFGKAQTGLDTSLFNKGLDPYSEAGQKAAKQLSDQKAFAYQNASEEARKGGTNEMARLFGLEMDKAGFGNNAYNQAVSNMLMQRQAPLSELGQLLSIGQGQAPQGGIANLAGPMNAQYQAQYNNYQNDLNNYNSNMGAMYGLGGNLLGAGIGYGLGGTGMAALQGAMMFSDERLKEDIKPVCVFNGHKLYEYVYKGDKEKRKFIGVMAQEVLKKNPWAVKMHRGFYRVNYAMLGIDFMRLNYAI